MLKKYKFEELISDLVLGRHVEFTYKDTKFSIENDTYSWYFVNKSLKDKELVCSCNVLTKDTEKRMMVNYFKRKKVDFTTVENIFNQFKYKDLYVI